LEIGLFGDLKILASFLSWLFFFFLAFEGKLDQFSLWPDRGSPSRLDLFF
jgi:hypothetical protein